MQEVLINMREVYIKYEAENSGWSLVMTNNWKLMQSRNEWERQGTPRFNVQGILASPAKVPRKMSLGLKTPALLYLGLIAVWDARIRREKCHTQPDFPACIYINANAFASTIWNGNWYLTIICTRIDHFTFTSTPTIV